MWKFNILNIVYAAWRRDVASYSLVDDDDDDDDEYNHLFRFHRE